MKKQPKEIPVFIFMGFLESGKTKFCEETLVDRDFTEGDKALLIVTEEGIEEYDEDEDVLRYEEEDVFPDDLFFSFYYYSLQVLLLGKPLLDKNNEQEAILLELLTEIES